MIYIMYLRQVLHLEQISPFHSKKYFIKMKYLSPSASQSQKVNPYKTFETHRTITNILTKPLCKFTYENVPPVIPSHQLTSLYTTHTLHTSKVRNLLHFSQKRHQDLSTYKYYIKQYIIVYNIYIVHNRLDFNGGLCWYTRDRVGAHLIWQY